MTNSKLLNEAIDDYSLLSKGNKKILKTLVEVNIDGYATISIKELAKLSNLSGTAVTQGLVKLEALNIISDINRRGNIFTGCRTVRSAISDIITVHKVKNRIL